MFLISSISNRMIYRGISFRGILNKLRITRNYNLSGHKKGYDLMAGIGDEESLLPTEVQKKATRKTLANDISIKIVGSGARGAPTCVCLYTSDTRYIFNCSESTQRINNEHKSKLCKLSKINNVFITTPTWKNIGGLPGFLLCLQSHGVNSVNIHGPPGTIDIVDASRKFVYLKRLNVIEANVDQKFIDNVLTVNYIHLKNSDENDETDCPTDDDSTIIDNIDYYTYGENKTEKRNTIIYGNNIKRVKRESVCASGRIRTSMCYAVKIHPRIGRLNLEKCVEKGIQPGPMLSLLKSGKDVTLPNGDVVKSVDVVDSSEPGPLFIVVDCPRESLLEVLVNNPEFEKYQSVTAPSSDMVAVCVIHFTPEIILNDVRYKKWMEKFGSSTHHIIVNENNKCLGTEAVYRLQHQLHLLHNEIFPFLNESHLENNEENELRESQDVVESESTPTTDNKVVQNDAHPLIHRAKTLDIFDLLQKERTYEESVIKISPREYLNEILTIEGFLDSLAELQTNLNSVSKKLGKIQEYPKIIILGTSSTANTKTRNTSCILLRVDEERSIIMDCGEGSFHQFFRMFGDKTDNILSTVKAIYVSHLHADHHLGLIGLLQERSRITQEPVYLLAPDRIQAWLHFFGKRYDSLKGLYVMIPNSDFHYEKHEVHPEIQKKLYQTLNVEDISTVPVEHCPFAYGVAIKLTDGRRIVYSGDTMPCESLAKMGQKCDLLIHEATIGNDNTTSARLKFHSTVTQAIRMGEKMRAKFTLLTHFGQRASKTYYFPEIEDSPDTNKIAATLDNMHIRLDELPILPLFSPCFRILCYSNMHVLEEDGKIILGKSKTKRQREIDRMNGGIAI